MEAKSDSSPSSCNPSLPVVRSNISGATHVGACTPFVTDVIGTSAVSKPGHIEPNMLRLTSPCSRLTPLARWPSRNPMCAMLNMPGSSSSAPRARIRSIETPGQALAPPKYARIRSSGNRSMPAGTGVWVVNTVPARTACSASSKPSAAVLPATGRSTSSRIRSRPRNPA